jgi:RNA polymerase sigma factor (TIGR02999 family)
MSDVTRLMDAAAAGDRKAAADLLPLVYDELRALAAALMAAEPADHTLQPTALVHEAFARLVGSSAGPEWDSRGHFFGAAAEAMRRILIESARRKKRERHGGGRRRVPLGDGPPAASEFSDNDLLAVHEVVDQLAGHDPAAADLVKLHVFAGLPLEEAARLLGVSARTGYRLWNYSRVWMFRRLGGTP